MSLTALNEILSAVTPADIRTELFARGDYDFITHHKERHHVKQEMALKALMDKDTTILAYGGSAGGAKTWTGSAWLLFMCLIHAGSKWFIGRNELKRITESTLVTFLKVAKEYGVTDFKFNGQKNHILFDNGSKIDLLDLKYLPSDPFYERFGSLEYTGGWIEEAGEVDFRAYDTLKSRVGRHMNDAFQVTAKILLTTNPKKNWLYHRFFKPWRESCLPEGHQFIQALVHDNPFIESGYIKNLESITDKAKKERLLHGNWEYDVTPNALCQYEDILAIFENDHIFNPDAKVKRYITADVARYGSDRAIVVVWEGWTAIDFCLYDISSTVAVQDCINRFRREYQIPKSRAIADQDGVGGGVVDNCGIEGFVNNAKPRREDVPSGAVRPTYANLQTQCGYHLAKKINDSAFYWKAELPPEEREMMIEELEQLQSDKPDNDRKLYLKSKEAIKKDLARSPDWRDVLLMRCWFDMEDEFVMKMT